MRLLIASNLDARKPFGQFTRPYHLGTGLQQLGVDVAHVAFDGEDLPNGEIAWSTKSTSLRVVGRSVKTAVAAFAPDVVYAHQNLPAAAALLSSRKDGPAVVADFHSLPSVEWAHVARMARGRDRLAPAVQSVKTRLIERYIAAHAKNVVTAGFEVSAFVRDHFGPRCNPVTVPNGVYAGMLHLPPGDSPYQADGSKHVVATIPAGASPANVAALEFLEAVGVVLRESATRVTVHVVGSQQAKADTPLVFHGVVSDLGPWLSHADACILPYPPEAALFGGARNKLLEALAMGQRLVTTREGLRGLEEAADWDGVTVASDTPSGFAGMVETALNARVSLEPTRSSFVERFTWDELAKQVLPVLERSQR